VEQEQWSFWVKRGTISNGDQVISTCHLDGSNQDIVRFSAADRLEWWSYQAGSYSNGGQLIPNRVFRDCNSWYHIVLRWDSSNSTAGDRMKIWVNGVEETSFNTDTNPTSGRESLFNYGNNSQKWIIGSGNDTQYFDGSISHMHFCDNQLYQASDFGETDTTTGEWKGKTSPSVNYGTNGFLILKDGNTITDQSSNSNDWSLRGGTLTDLKDNPDNVFTTMNPLDNYWQGSTFSNGNNTIVTGSNSTTFNTSTLMMTSGKYYVEVKPTVGSATLNIGVTGEQAVNASQTLASRGTGYAYLSSSGVFNNGSSVGGTFNSYTNGDIIGIAVDLDNNKLYFSKNGTWQNSGDPTSGSTGTGAVSITDPSNLIGESKMGAYAFAMNETWNDNTRTVQWNFGNGYFGTTAVSSAGTNASDNGIFEYDVPTGYTALSTKGLNE
jgi:hypothetical protein